MDGKGQLSLSLLNRFELCFIKLYCLRDGGVLVTRMSSGGASNEAANPLGLSQVSSPSPGTWGPLWLLFLTAEDCILVMKLRHANRKITDTVGKNEPFECISLLSARVFTLHLLLTAGFCTYCFLSGLCLLVTCARGSAVFSWVW